MRASIPTTHWTIIIIAAVLAAGCVDTPRNAVVVAPGGGIGVVACQTGQSSCASLTEARACGIDGNWTTSACTADQVCEDGACAALACTPKQATCDGTKAVVCSARGTKSRVIETCGAGKACVAGKCVGDECSAGEAKCIGNTLVRCLDGATTWQKTICGKEESCDATGGPDGGPACKEQTCWPGTATCDGSKAMVCSKDGLKQESTDDCAKAGNDGKARVCLKGTCVAKVCAPGEKTCLGNVVATCSDNRAQWNKVACAEGEICSAGACAKQKCVPGETFCDGLKVTHCSADGLTTKVSHVCDANLQECKGGACVDMAIVCGDGFCDQGESIDNCKTDCKQAPGIASDFDQLAPQAKTTLPRAPRKLKSKAPHPSHTGQALAVGDKWLYVVDRDNGTLVLMDIDNLAVAHTLKVGGRPHQVVVGADGTVYVSIRDDGVVLRLLAGETSMANAVKWQVGIEPMGLALEPGGKALLVTLHGESSLIAIDTISGTELGRAQVGDLPRNVTARPDGKAVVLRGAGEVALVAIKDLVAGNSTKPVAVKATFAMLRTANPVPVCRGQVEIPSRSPNRAVSSTVDPDTGDVLISHVLVAFGNAQSVLLAAKFKPKVKSPPKAVKVCSPGGYGSTCKIVPPPPCGVPCFSSPVRPYEVTVSTLLKGKVQVEAKVKDVAVVDPITNRSFLTRFDQPASITHHPILTTAFVAAMGTNNVMLLNTAAKDPMQSPFGDIKVGGGPRAIVISADGNKAWVLNSTSFTVSEVDLTPLMKYHDTATANKGFTQLQKIEPIFLQHNKQVAYGTDPLPKAAALGRKVFHNSKNSRLTGSNRFACATCHLDGTEDKGVWFIVDGPRQTPSLAGRINGTAPFNWLGSKFTLIENFKQTTTRMGGTGLLDIELAGLKQFLLVGLKPPVNPNKKKGGLTPQQLAGKKIYDDPVVACNDCHSAPNFTDGAQHDVGTATPLEMQVQKIFAGCVTKSCGPSVKCTPDKVVFNTPSLRGLYYTAPYLHDGSAKTLKDALKQTATTMGKTDHLSDKQLDDLVAYLKTL